MANLLLGIRKLMALTRVARRDCRFTSKISLYFVSGTNTLSVDNAFLKPTKAADTNTHDTERLVFYFKISRYFSSASTTLSAANLLFGIRTLIVLPYAARRDCASNRDFLSSFGRSLQSSCTF